MIIEKTGKHTSVRTGDEEFGVLAEVYLSMPPDEREAFDFMIEPADLLAPSSSVTISVGGIASRCFVKRRTSERSVMLVISLFSS